MKINRPVNEMSKEEKIDLIDATLFEGESKTIEGRRVFEIIKFSAKKAFQEGADEVVFVASTKEDTIGFMLGSSMFSIGVIEKMFDRLSLALKIMIVLKLINKVDKIAEDLKKKEED